MRRRHAHRRIAAALATAAIASCSAATPPVDPGVLGTGTPILFVGNSHTYVNDVPGILQALADAAGGEKVAVLSVAVPNYALIDHWNDGGARREIAKRTWAYVVLQLGWTPAGVCRDTLRLAAQRFAPEIRQAGARPALFETWPPESQPNQLLGSVESYRLAAKDVDGLLFPVAEAWSAATRRDPTISLYADGLHANGAGSYLAALVMYTRIFQRSPVGLPATLRTRSGVSITLPAALAATLQAAAEEVGLAPTPDVEPTAPPVITSRC
jgi:hypothetical protein